MAMHKLMVTGMHCTSCETILKEDLGQIKGLSKISVDHKTGVVSFDGPAGLVSEAKAAIEADGYSVQ